MGAVPENAQDVHVVGAMLENALAVPDVGAVLENAPVALGPGAWSNFKLCLMSFLMGIV